MIQFLLTQIGKLKKSESELESKKQDSLLYDQEFNNPDFNELPNGCVRVLGGVTNAPVATGTEQADAFVVFTLKNKTNGYWAGIQLAIGYSTSKLYYRRIWSTWGDWKAL